MELSLFGIKMRTSTDKLEQSSSSHARIQTSLFGGGDLDIDDVVSDSPANSGDAIDFMVTNSRYSASEKAATSDKVVSHSGKQKSKRVVSISSRSTESLPASAKRMMASDVPASYESSAVVTNAQVLADTRVDRGTAVDDHKERHISFEDVSLLSPTKALNLSESDHTALKVWYSSYSQSSSCDTNNKW
jgi:hypothetical protein